MSEKLRSIGTWSFKHKWSVVSSWLLILVVVTGLMIQFHQPLSTAESIPGTESQRALDKLAQQRPDIANGSGNIVFAAPTGKSIASEKVAIESSLKAVMAESQVSAVDDPFVTGTISTNGRIAIAGVSLKVKAANISATLPANIQHDLAAVRISGLQAEVSGDIAPSNNISAAGTVIGVGIAAIVLMLTFGALIAAGMPLLIAFLTVALGLLGLNAFSGLFKIADTAQTLSVMLGLAVGIDYSLFIITRYRKYLLEGLEPVEAAGQAISTAGNAVIFAALTVVIALSALAVTGIPFLTVMGLAAAGTVAIAALVANTLVPALLGFAKYRVLGRKARRTIKAGNILTESVEDQEMRRTLGYRWASLLARGPVIAIIVFVALLGVIALPITSMHLGFKNDGNSATNTTQRKAYDLTAQGFGAGTNGPLIVVADLLKGSNSETSISQITKTLQNLPNVSRAQLAGKSADGKSAIFQIIPNTGPDSDATKQLVNAIRHQSNTGSVANSALAVTGATAVAIDVENKLAHALPLYILVVLGLSLLILLMVFRSVVIPIKATLGFLLTIGATFGALVMLFQWGWFGLFTPGPIISFLPIIITGILFGLAMDYEFFIVSGMHEAYVLDKTKDAKKAVLLGVGHGGRVVSAAAIIMFSVFAGFMTNTGAVQAIAFALAFGVFVDAFVVRMTLVPAVMILAGRAAWWLPKWLDKIIPNLSIEGKDRSHP